MFQILIKTIKLSVASLAAILIANMLGIENGISAGIIAILSVLDSRAATIRGAIDRIFSAFIGLSIGVICFKAIGYNPYAFSMFLLLFVPISMYIKIGIGLVPTSVLVTHLWLAKDVNLSLLVNEMLIVILGCIIAIVVNFYFPSGRRKLYSKLNKLNIDIGNIFNLFYRELTTNFNYDSYNELYEDLYTSVMQMEKMAKIEDQNNILSGDKTNSYLVNIAKEKVRILRDMIKVFKMIPKDYYGGGEFAEIINEVALKINSEYDMNIISEKLKDVYSIYREKPLPVTREEFEIRAAMFRLLVQLEEFVSLNYSVSK